MATRDEDRFRILKESLASIGPLRRGTVLRRFMSCGNPACRCKADPPKRHGPYYEWTRKVRGKTVSVRLTPNQARLMKQWVANSRRLDRIVAALDRASCRLTEPLFKAAGKPQKPRRRTNSCQNSPPDG
jgi:hypothetical protein